MNLEYGTGGHFECEIDGSRLVASPAPPAPLDDVAGHLRSALASPLDFPPLDQAVIPDDRVVLALDRDTPSAGVIIGEIWRVLRRRGVSPDRVTILQPAALAGAQQSDPRCELPADVKDDVQWKLHDPTDDKSCGYLATTTTGERVYLARDVTEADVVVSVGQVSFDSLLGYRGTNSVFFPGLSKTDALAQAHGQGHRELGPDDDRPLRQMIDEVGWMLGTQFSVQVVASSGTGTAQVLAGATDSVFHRGRRFLSEHWLVEVDARPEIVVAGIDHDAGGHGWQQMGKALSSARNLVADGGRIVILSELSAEPGPGLELIRQGNSPRDALQPLRAQHPPDLSVATELAAAADWANVYLLSQLDGDTVEELFMMPLESDREAARLLRGEESCLFLPSAQHTFGRLR